MRDRTPDLPFTIDGNEIRYPDGTKITATPEAILLHTILCEIQILTQEIRDHQKALEFLTPPIKTQG